jgi:hypothetical protein
MRASLCIVVCVLLTSHIAHSHNTEIQAPNQDLGTTVYFVPKQHADKDMAVHGHGFVAIVLQQTDENNIRPTFVAHSAAEFVTAYARLPRKLQQYGIWITLQEHDPYSPEEKAMLEELKTLCRKHAFPLFIHTGREDRGWLRFSGSAAKRSNQAMQPTAG